MWGYLRRKAAGPRFRWSLWETRWRKSRETEGGVEFEARMRSCMDMTFSRFLYFSINFSNVGSRNLESTYWAEVVLVRRRTAVAPAGRIFLKMWAAIAQPAGVQISVLFLYGQK